MNYSVCVIDDGVIAPANKNGIDDRGPLNSALLKKLLQNKADWNAEIPLYNFFKGLIAVSDDGKPVWIVTAFSNPNFYLNCFDRELFRCDVLVFDWDYPGGLDYEAVLGEIFTTSHCIVYIFSGADKVDEINAFLADTKFLKYKSRAFVYDKEVSLGEKSETPAAMVDALNKLREGNFAFRFGGALRTAANRSLDRILIRLGEVHINETLRCLTSGEPDEVEADLKQMMGEKVENHLKEDGDLDLFLRQHDLDQNVKESLIDLIAKKVGNDMQSLSLDVAPTPAEEATASGLADELWSYRLYHQPNDDIVRKGDIVHTADDPSVLYLVVTPDCDLNRFWHKYLGYVNTVKIYSIIDKKEKLKEIGLLTRKREDIRNIKVKSCSNSIDAIGGSSLCVPFLPISGVFRDYLLFPKELCSELVIMPDDVKANQDRKKRGEARLTYSRWPEHKRVCTISEPFLTPVVDHILAAVAGYGTPDYPGVVQKTLATKLKGVFE